MTKRLIILGTGGSVYDILDIVAALNAQSPAWEIAGFLDDARAAGTSHLNLPILGRLVDAVKFTDCKFINAIGSVATYSRRAELIASTGLPIDAFATLIHPSSGVSKWANIGVGCYVSYGASVGGAASIGDFVSICPEVIIGHDSIIGAYTVIAPGACISGSVTIGQSVYIGSRAVIRHKQKIGENALIGMGAAVVSDVERGETVVGVPARPLLKRLIKPDIAVRPTYAINTKNVSWSASE